MAKLTASIKLLKTEPSKAKDNALLIGFLKDKMNLSGELKAINNEFGSIISSYIENMGFKGEKGEVKNIYLNKNIKNLVLVGLGEEEKFGLDTLAAAIADVSKKLRDNGTESFSVLLSSFSQNKFKEQEAVEKIALGALLGLYKFTDYKTKDKDKLKFIKQITIVHDTNNGFNKELGHAGIIAEAVNKTRDLVNTPPNVANPEYVAEYAKETAKKLNLKCTIFDESQIKNMDMGCFMGVAQ